VPREQRITELTTGLRRLPGLFDGVLFRLSSNKGATLCLFQRGVSASFDFSTVDKSIVVHHGFDQ
jgi:hypothetical protein